MVKLHSVQAWNSGLKTLAPGLVAVFVGGTSGISLSTALALARNTQSPKIYLVGRSQSAADAAMATMRDINPTARPTFIQSDVSLLRNVDSVCAQIAARENRLNLLFMTAGVGTLAGRTETAEGLDRKFSLHYYARMRFVDRLLPLLEKAGVSEPSLARVVSVLDPHGADRAPGLLPVTLDYSDLSLKKTFSSHRCASHATLMNNFFLERLAQSHPTVSFVHSYPAGVETGIARNMPLARLMFFLIRPFLVPLEESGERHLYAATHGSFAPRAAAGEAAVGDEVAAGSDGVKGSGCYWTSWDDEVMGPNRKIADVRKSGAVDKVAEHTAEVFRAICDEGRTYP